MNDDGTPVEPQFYVPILPMVLINGSKGIGTGFSTEIMCYNPLQIIGYLKNKLQQFVNNESEEFLPYYEGFTGDITKINDSKFLFRGKYEKMEQDKIRVTELPIGVWTEDFKELLCELQNDKDKDGKKVVPLVKDVYENYTDTTVEFVVTFSKGKVAELEALKGDHGTNGLEKALKLYSTSSTTNMNLFNEDDKLKKYDSVEDIIDDYYVIRLHYYGLRKDYMIDALERELVLLSNKAKYIQENLDGTIDLRKKKKEQVVQMLEEKGFEKIDDDEEYKYLIKMPMDSVTEENVERLLKEKGNKESELKTIQKTSINKMWLSELEELKNNYTDYKEERTRLMNGEESNKKKKVVSKGAIVKKSGKKPLVVTDEEN